MAKLRTQGVANTLTLKDRLLNNHDILAFLDVTFTADLLAEFIDVLQRKLPGNIPRDVLNSSLVELAGVRLTHRLLEDLAWRLAGNTVRMQSGYPAPEWSVQTRTEWAPVQVLSGDRRWRNNGRAEGLFQLRVLAGSACPRVIEKAWTLKFCAYLARRIGFTRSTGLRPFKDLLDFVNLRFQVKLEPKLCGQGPMFEEVRATSSLVSWNRTLLTMRTRSRTSGFVCPQDYPASFPCHLCQIGLDQCPVAVHEQTFTAKLCTACNTVAWFDPAKPTRTSCVNCYQEASRRRR